MTTEAIEPAKPAELPDEDLAARGLCRQRGCGILVARKLLARLTPEQHKVLINSELEFIAAEKDERDRLAKEAGKADSK